MKRQKMIMISRRNVMYLLGGMASTALFSNYALAKPNLALKRIKEISKNNVEETDLFLDVPEIAENGNTVPISVDAPGAVAVTILAAGNPLPGVATFNFGDGAGSQSATTRIRLAGTQDVIAVAKMADGSFAAVSKMVKVTIGGCGG